MADFIALLYFLSRATNVEFAEDSSLMSSGFGDSNLRVWTLTPNKLRAVKQLEELELIDKEAGRTGVFGFHILHSST